MNVNDAATIAYLFNNLLVLAMFIGFMFSLILHILFKIALKKFNRPASVKSLNDVRLYRANNGFYVEKHLLEKLNADFSIICKKRKIAFHKRIIENLEKP